MKSRLAALLFGVARAVNSLQGAPHGTDLVKVFRREVCLELDLVLRQGRTRFGLTAERQRFEADAKLYLDALLEILDVVGQSPRPPQKPST